MGEGRSLVSFKPVGPGVLTARAMVSEGGRSRAQAGNVAPPELPRRLTSLQCLNLVRVIAGAGEVEVVDSL